ncbi:MAG: toxin-antitoxin system YwqK family antitoxin [Deltaproteobacteria bacterium]|nr:MAG: toxin-antitoxin system YwqK family antitoxin [Deltaproteobacteria bacterium]
MTHRALLLLLPLLACGKKGPLENAADLAYPEFGDLTCAEQHRFGGAPPPIGTEIFCVSEVTGTPTRNGNAIRYYPSGEIAARGDYRYDKQIGEWTVWYRDGSLKRKEAWLNGIAEGTWAEFHPGGVRRAQGPMIEGQREGLWTFFDEEGNRYLEGHYSNGHEDGVWREYLPDGTPVRERLYRDGRLLRQSEL